MTVLDVRGYGRHEQRLRERSGLFLMAFAGQQEPNLHPQHDTHTRTHLSSLGSCLVQEIKVGRSIQESPLTLLPSYSTWNSTTEEEEEEASHRKIHPSVVNDRT